MIKDIIIAFIIGAFGGVMTAIVENYYQDLDE